MTQQPIPKSRRRLVLTAGLVGLLAAAAAKLGCRTTQTFTDPVPVDRTTFATAEPEAAAADRLRRAAAYSADRSGRAVVVLHGDRIVFEEYQNGHGPGVPHHIFSATKSFAGVMAMAAVADGLLDLDERVAETITEWQDDALKSRITVRHLLHFTSGLEQAFFSLSMDGFVVPEEQRIEDKYRFALDLDLVDPPGTRYSYGSVHLMVFGELVKRKLGGRDPLDYLDERVLSRIGYRHGGWNRDAAGNPMLPYGCWATARELLKLGALVRDDGVFGGERILPAGLLHGCLRGSEAMPAYGLTFWLNAEVPERIRGDLIPQLRDNAERGGRAVPGAPADLAVAAGHDGNRVYIVPSRDLVIVRLGASERDFLDEDFLALALEGDPPR